MHINACMVYLRATVPGLPCLPTRERQMGQGWRLASSRVVQTSQEERWPPGGRRQGGQARRAVNRCAKLDAACDWLQAHATVACAVRCAASQGAPWVDRYVPARCKPASLGWQILSAPPPLPSFSSRAPIILTREERQQLGHPIEADAAFLCACGAAARSSGAVQRPPCNSSTTAAGRTQALGLELVSARQTLAALPQAGQ